MTDVWKSYGGVVALAGANLEVRAGEVHAVLGENGAGKSTLMKVLAGAVRPDSGTVEVDGQAVPPGSRDAARSAGVAMVFQHPQIVDELSIAENITLGREVSRFGVELRRSLHDRSSGALTRIGWRVDPHRKANGLGPGERQLIDIARAISVDCGVLVLDEPTASLGAEHVDSLFGVIGELRAAGTAIVYISHRLAEIERLADRITVLRDGLTVATVDARTTSRSQLVRLMVGRDVDLTTRRSGAGAGDVVLGVDRLSAANGLRDVSMTVRSGEIVGVYGLLGSGRTELVRAIIGSDRRTAGTVTLQGRALRASPVAAADAGMGIVPEDRTRQGCLLALSVTDNVALPNRRRLSRLGWTSPRRDRRAAEDVVTALAVKADGISAPLGSLSGGNQQKIVFGRWLVGDTQVLVLDDPTVGVDIAAKGEIHSIIAARADAGAAILLASSDLPELLNLSDRIIVMRDRRVVGEIGRDEWTEEAALLLAIGERIPM